MKNVDLFDTPVKSVYVRKNVYAHKYSNGTININGQKFLGYSLTESIKIFRSKFKHR